MSIDPQNKRDGLIEQAKIGKITGEEADAEAIRLGLGSLSRTPGPSEFRPEAETHWTLPMAVAWIGYRDLDEVREWSAPYREACFDWHWQRWRRGFDGPLYEGWHLEQRSKPTLSRLAVSAAVDSMEGAKPLAMPINEARQALWIALRESFIPASGVDTETGRRDEIPALDWHELVHVERRGETDEVRRGLSGTGYTGVLIPSIAVRGFWLKRVQSTVRLPPTISPDGDGFMPLYCAAQWIATEGGVLDFPPDDPSRWRHAYGMLLAAITSENVRVVGLRAGERERIGSHVFVGIRVDYPFEDPELDLMAGSELYLRSHPYLDEQHWRNGFDDALIHKRQKKWTHLMVDKASIRRLWPFETKVEVADQQTGLPGRPGKARHLIEDELKRRAAEGRLASTLADEAKALLAWLIEAHPKSPRPTVGVIRNNIRGSYRQLMTRTK